MFFINGGTNLNGVFAVDNGSIFGEPTGSFILDAGANGADVVVEPTFGMVGIGTFNPTAQLDVNGSLRYTNGTEGLGNVLTSDANGNANWKPLDSLLTGGNGITISGDTINSLWTLATNGLDIFNNNSGNVGVGTNTPTSYLHVVGPGTQTTSSLRGEYNGSTDVVPAVEGWNYYGSGINVIGVLGANGSFGWGAGVVGYGYGPTDLNTATNGSHNDIGVYGSSDQYGVWGQTSSEVGTAIFGNNTGGGYAGRFIGTVQIQDGTQNAGYVFTSDANGNGSWQNQGISALIGGTGITISNDSINSLWTLAGNGVDMFNNNTGFVGVGTTAPVTELHVVDPVNANVATFDGAAPMWVSFYEAGTPIGYVGSYSGNANDFDMGTYGSNTTGNFNFTIQDAIKMSISGANGYVGIPTTTPAAQLDVRSDNVASGNDAVDFSDLGGLVSYPNSVLNLTNNGDGYTLLSNKSGLDESFIINKNNTSSSSVTMWVTGNQSVGVPTLQVDAANNVNAALFNGVVSVVDGSQASNYVFTSDAFGNGKWRSLDSLLTAGNGIQINNDSISILLPFADTLNTAVNMWDLANYGTGSPIKGTYFGPISYLSAGVYGQSTAAGFSPGVLGTSALPGTYSIADAVGIVGSSSNGAGIFTTVDTGAAAFFYANGASEAILAENSGSGESPLVEFVNVPGNDSTMFYVFNEGNGGAERVVQYSNTNAVEALRVDQHGYGNGITSEADSGSIAVYGTTQSPYAGGKGVEGEAIGAFSLSGDFLGNIGTEGINRDAVTGGFGVLGVTASSDNGSHFAGVTGVAVDFANTGPAYGVAGYNFVAGVTGAGVAGFATDVAYGTYGYAANAIAAVHGDQVSSTTGRAGEFIINDPNATNSDVAVFGSTNGTGSGVWGEYDGTSATGYGVYGYNANTLNVAGNVGVYGTYNSAFVYGAGVSGIGYQGIGLTSATNQDIGVYASARDYGVQANSQLEGVFGTVGGFSSTTITNWLGSQDEEPEAAGVVGTSTNDDGGYTYGVVGLANNPVTDFTTNVGMYAEANNSSTQNIGIVATENGSTGQDDALFAYDEQGLGDAGVFIGNVFITGNLAKGGGTFKIDHPLDPENKYLEHSFVESPDMMNIYNGNVTTDANGYATITMPDYFKALNTDFRYQLTCMGTFAQAIVAEKMNGNSFRIQTDKPNVEVSWQVTGVRQDKWANANRVVAETEKESYNKGKYLHPKLFGAGQDKQIGLPAGLGGSKGKVSPAAVKEKGEAKPYNHPVIGSTIAKPAGLSINKTQATGNTGSEKKATVLPTNGIKAVKGLPAAPAQKTAPAQKAPAVGQPVNAVPANKTQTNEERVAAMNKHNADVQAAEHAKIAAQPQKAPKVAQAPSMQGKVAPVKPVAAPVTVPVKQQQQVSPAKTTGLNVAPVHNGPSTLTTKNAGITTTPAAGTKSLTKTQSTTSPDAQKRKLERQNKQNQVTTGAYDKALRK